MSSFLTTTKPAETRVFYSGADKDFTAKDFRTWNGTAQAALELETLGAGECETQAKKNI
jgi:DNA topoisomerase IB